MDAGTYKVRFYLVAEDGYDLSAEQVYADMTISTEGVAALPRFAAVNAVLRARNGGDSQGMGRTAFQDSHGGVLPRLANGQGGPGLSGPC